MREALAFAVPGELGIDEVWALVVPASSLDEDALQRFCWEKLPHAQVPYDSSPSPTFPAPKLASWIGIG